MQKIKQVTTYILVFLFMMTPLPEGFGGKVYAASRNIIVTVAGTGAMGFSGDGGAATSTGIYNPYGVAIDSTGTVYIADSQNYRIRKIDASSGIITTVAGTGFPGFSGDGGLATAAQLGIPYGIAFDSSDNLYIADMSNSRIRKVDKLTGNISTVAGNGSAGFSGDGGSATSAQLSQPLGVAIDGIGNLYIADSANNCVRKVDTSGTITTVAGNGDPASWGWGDGVSDGGLATAGELYYPSGVAIDGDGNLYIADAGNNRIRKVDKATGYISTVAGKGSTGYSGDGGLATAAQLNVPRGIAIDNIGNLFIADRGNHSIRKVDMSTGKISTVAGNGSAGFSGDLGSATSAQLNYPYAIAIGSNGNLYIADSNNQRIRRVGPSNDASLSGLTLSNGSISPAFNPATTSYTASVPNAVSSITVTPTVRDSYATVTVNGTPVTSGSASSAINLSVGDTITLVVTAEDGTVKTYTLTRAISSNASLSGLALSNGSLSPTFASGTTSYVASVANSVSSITVTPTVSDSTATVVVNGTTVTSGSASGTISLSVGAGGNPITIAVTAQDGTTKTYTVTATRASPTGSGGSGSDIISTVAGNGSGGYSGDGGAATSAQLRVPWAVAIDSSGNLYIADAANHRIRKVDKSTGNISTVAGNGSFGYSGDGGLATSAQLNGPRGVAIDSDGNLYIADTGNHRIRKVDPSGIVSTLVGNGVAGYSGDGGAATSAQVSMPYRVATDSVGDLYIVDANNFRIRKVDKLTGNISTLVGNGVRGSGGDGGAATSAQVDFPYGLAFDSLGNLYIADNRGARIRKVDKLTGNINTVAGTGVSGYSGDEGAATLAQLYSPSGLAFDGSDNMYIAEGSNPLIRKVDQSTGIISTVAGNGSNGYSGDGGAATSAELYGPSGLAIDSSGNLIIADTNNNVIRKVGQSHDANLNSLSLSSGSLSPAFVSGTIGYTANVANSVSSITVTPAVSDSTAKVKVNGVPVTNGSTSGAINLAVGSNAPITVLVTAEDGTTTKTYTVTVTRASNSNANLSDLTLSSGSLSPVFASGTISYTSSVANSVSSITVTPTVSDSTATVKVNGTVVSSGSASGAISLSVGSNTISVVATAQDGTTTKTYTVTVTRAPYSNASLNNLTLSSGSLSPAFASGTASYTASVANSVSSIAVTPIVSDSTATMKVNGTVVTSGSASGAISLNVGSNSITIEVMAQDGTTTKTYTVTVTRASATVSGGSSSDSRSHNANLNSLTLSSGSLSSIFTSGTTSYTASVPNGVSSITVTPTVSDSTATVKVNGIPVPSGVASGAISLSVGDNPITITVTAQDGTTTQMYTVTVTRANDKATPPPASDGPILNDKITNVQKVKEADQAALNRTALKPFLDVPADHWSSEAIQVARQLGIIQGRPDGNFHGSDNITRAEFVAMVANALYFDTTSYSGTMFSDTKDHWAGSAIDALTAAGVIQGMGDGSFKPDRQITRGEISAILARLIVFGQTTGNTYFSDTSDSWARQSIDQMAEADIVIGAGDGMFYPKAYSTREQAVAMILRMLTVCRNIDLKLIDVSR
ncbi:hypothetical protein D7Z26_11610 [Cohnella endophytica]|uniref:SLH domain-containing protein n=1 Tax=Cohnella endophytica TaxID=2419778 RepID=A0A494XYC6_9BACL|nr:cadherin-like beta sandwich domain-containing protein [Cohnella endophytica]RKP54029.1 hypothetical protein D7Z26_11610 [Cohnella endophytica]